MSSDSTPVRRQIKQLIIDRLRLEDLTVDQIGDDTVLWGNEGLGLDSIDALELVTALEGEFGLRIEDGDIDQESLSTVAQLEKMLADAGVLPSSGTSASQDLEATETVS